MAFHLTEHGFNIHYRRDINDRSSIKFVYNYTNINSESDEILELVSNHAIKIKCKYKIFNNLDMIFDTKYAGEK